jgi:hypothetical protein
MRVSIVAGLIVAVHVAVIGSVVMTQGCASTQRGAGVDRAGPVDPAPAPCCRRPCHGFPAVVQPVTFPAIQPPTWPGAVKTDRGRKRLCDQGRRLCSRRSRPHGINGRELAELNKITDPNKIAWVRS